MKKQPSIADLAQRIEALERAVFVEKPRKKVAQSDDFKGATGGLRLLFSNGFFDHRRQFSEVEAEMKKHGYHYSKQAIQTPLNRMSRSGGPLVGLKEQGHKVYVKRK